jgi:glyoxylase I family protein
MTVGRRRTAALTLTLSPESVRGILGLNLELNCRAGVLFRSELTLPALRLEHVALNVTDPVAIAAWYVSNLGMRVVHKVDAPPHIHFLLDANGKTILELYYHSAARVPDYAAMSPLELHVAFTTDDPDGDRDALVGGGATLVDERQLDDGSRLVMLRDPWGLALQLVKRATPLRT